MFPRLLKAPDRSFFLFGPRGTGKSSWIRSNLPEAYVFDLLDEAVYVELLASPWLLERRVPAGHEGWVVIDEIQRVPELLNEVHRLIEAKRWRFALTGSSARKLRRKGTNLLAGRAITLAMHPLCHAELGNAADLAWSLRNGQLPTVQADRDPEYAKQYLRSYVATYLREEVQQEGLTRNLAAFGRFLEAASFSQGGLLNVSAVARECHVDRKVCEDYFSILEDLLLAERLAPFSRRAKRELTAHPKFYYFDVGVWRALRPRGPLDSEPEIEGPAMETLLLQEIRAVNDGLGLDYTVHYWRTRTGLEVDFVLYGERGLHAFEVKRASRVRGEDLASLHAFLEDYPMATATLVYGGERSWNEGNIRVRPLGDVLRTLVDDLSRSTV